MVSSEESLLVLVVGGPPEVVCRLPGLVEERNGYAIGFVAVDHSPEAQTRVCGDAYAAVVVFDDFTGRSVLRDLAHADRPTPVVALIDEPDPARRMERRTVLRNAGASASVFMTDLSGATLEQAILCAVETRRLAAGLEQASALRRPAPAGLLRAPAFMRRLDASVAGAAAESCANYSLIWVDASRLAGSGVLDHERLAQTSCTLRERIVAAAHPNVVGDLGDDRYGVLVAGRRDVEDLETLERLRAATGRGLAAGSGEVYADVGVGIARGAVIDASADDAVRRAQALAVYPATGLTTRTAAPSEADDKGRTEAAAVEQALRGAISRGELSVKYQPILDIADNAKTLGFEALLRWDEPGSDESHAAAEFIEVAQRSDLIISLGYWALEAAVVQLAEWIADFELRGAMFVAVNLSGRQVSDALLASRIRSLLMTTGLDADALRLEVPAQTVVDDPDAVARLARELSEIGVGLWIQDFGDGIVDVDQLRRMPIAGVKLARRIAAQLDGTSRTSGPVLHAMKAARALGIKVVAEGVENALQANVLRANGCTVAQGYLYAEPLGVGEVFGRLARGGQ